MLNLPKDILVDILARLSMKTLSHCRFVCKDWFYTIQSPNFVAIYDNSLIHKNTDDDSCVILQRTSQLLDRDFKTCTLKLPPLYNMSATYHPPPLYNMSPTNHSSNGLLLLTTRYQQHNSYYVCNPITGYHIAIPRSPLHDERDVDVTIGFGYDPVSKLCKLIRILCTYTRVMLKVEICDVVTGEWRIMEAKQLRVTNSDLVNAFESTSLFSNNFLPNALVNGALHWISSCWKILPCWNIVSFKLDTEEFYHVPLPSTLGWSDQGSYLLVVRECLAVVDCGEFHHVAIWVMKDYGLESSWEKKCVISNLVMDNGDLVKWPYRPLRFMDNGEILLLLDKGIGYYQPVTKVFKLMIESVDAGADAEDYFRGPLLHVCSLISLGSIAR